MNLDEIEDLIRRYLSAGIAVVLILIAPGGEGGSTPATDDPAVVTVDPSADRAAPGSDPGGEPGLDDPEPESPELDARGPADGTEPGLDDEDPITTTTPRAPADPSGPVTGSAPSAAERLDWGTPDREDDFTSGLDQWELYDGPGHAGQGVRSPEAATVRDGVLTLTGDASGTTAGMSWGQGQRYGRWEGRVRAPASDPSYNALLLLWPDAEDFPVGGEIDFMEMLDPTRQRTDFFLHHGADNAQVNGQVEIDATRWHNWAVEWTPEAIVAYVDGEEWFRSTDTATFPPGPMHLCIQLDWFPEGSGRVQESSMEVDWVRQYPLDGS